MMLTKSIVRAALVVAGGTFTIAQSAWAEPVNLHIAAKGTSVNRADQLTLQVPIITRGDSVSAARSANQKQIENVTAKLVAAGIDPGMMKLSTPPAKMGYVGSELLELTETGSAAPIKTAFSSLEISYGDPALSPRIRRALEDVCEGCGGTPQLALRDDRAAKESAIADGLANARREANAYASALGMKVASIRAVSNVREMRQGTAFDPEVFALITSEQEQDDGENVTTKAYVTVDFDLTPL